jgi:murein DD-endopeptidase MepM/ murein hydrolase activator NlpD
VLKTLTAAPFAVLLWTVSVYAQGPAHRWPAREPPVEPKPAHQLRDPGTWPPEPASPDIIEEGRFREAFVHMCTPRKDHEETVAALAPVTLKAARAESIDPFLLSAVVFYSSGCQPGFTSKGGVGLLNLSPAMYFREGAPQPPVDRAQFTKKALLDPANSLAVGARLLRMWKEQHVELDALFGGVAHRSEVSHFVWGDDVRGSGSEDLILTARRRMLLAYAGNVDKPRPSLYGISIVSPLEAPPRVATSGPGDDRDGGARQHRGLDITASLGEPVRSVADGVVVFAGANIPGAPRKGPIPPDKIGRYAHRQLGVGGIYLCIEHDSERHIRTCYMHLARYVVADTEHVSAGQLIGYVGRTGVRVSPPHLHFEVRVDERFTNPCRTLGDLVIPPKATMTHLYMLKAKRARRLRAEAAAAHAPPKA